MTQFGQYIQMIDLLAYVYEYMRTISRILQSADMLCWETNKLLCTNYLVNCLWRNLSILSRGEPSEKSFILIDILV